jgi:hypothetical protein
MTFSVDQPGIVYYLVQDAAETAPTDSFSFPLQSGVAYVEFEEAGSDDVLVEGLTDGTAYNVYTVFSNAYGAPGPIGESTVSTSDTTHPVLVDMLPANGSTNVSTTLSQVVLTFSEAVQLKDAAKVKIVDAFDESDLGIKGSITVSDNTVIIPLTGPIAYLIDVAVILEAGAFSDMAGNDTREYYLNEAEDNYALVFTIMDVIDMTVFSGAYHCVANEVGFGNGIIEYDVIMNDGSDASGYYIAVQNINNWTGSLVFLTIDPEVDTCYFEEQPTGLIYPGNAEDILINSLDENGLAGASFKPGNFNRDGSEVKVFGVLYISLGQFGFFEFTFTKMSSGAAQINYQPPLFNTPRMK